MSNRKENTKKSNYETDDWKRYSIRKWVLYVILFAIGAGLIVPYTCEIICVLWFPEKGITIEVWNQFVSIILGIVATVLSIVSMIMGFKNYDDAFALQDKYDRTLMAIKSIAKDVSVVKNDLKLSLQKKNVIENSDAIDSNRRWEKKNDEE